MAPLPPEVTATFQAGWNSHVYAISAASQSEAPKALYAAVAGQAATLLRAMSSAGDAFRHNRCRGEWGAQQIPHCHCRRPVPKPCLRVRSDCHSLLTAHRACGGRVGVPRASTVSCAAVSFADAAVVRSATVPVTAAPPASNGGSSSGGAAAGAGMKRMVSAPTAAPRSALIASMFNAPMKSAAPAASTGDAHGAAAANTSGAATTTTAGTGTDGGGSTATPARAPTVKPSASASFFGARPKANVAGSPNTGEDKASVAAPTAPAVVKEQGSGVGGDGGEREVGHHVRRDKGVLTTSEDDMELDEDAGRAKTGSGGKGKKRVVDSDSEDDEPMTGSAAAPPPAADGAVAGDGGPVADAVVGPVAVPAVDSVPAPPLPPARAIIATEASPATTHGGGPPGKTKRVRGCLGAVCACALCVCAVRVADLRALCSCRTGCFGGVSPRTSPYACVYLYHVAGGGHCRMCVCLCHVTVQVLVEKVFENEEGYIGA